MERFLEIMIFLGISDTCLEPIMFMVSLYEISLKMKTTVDQKKKRKWKKW